MDNIDPIHQVTDLIRKASSQLVGENAEIDSSVKKLNLDQGQQNLIKEKFSEQNFINKKDKNGDSLGSENLSKKNFIGSKLDLVI